MTLLPKFFGYHFPSHDLSSLCSVGMTNQVTGTGLMGKNLEVRSHPYSTKTGLTNFEFAKVEALKAVEIAPNEAAKAAGYIRLGVAMFNLADYDEALESFETSDSIQSTSDSRQWIVWCKERLCKLTKIHPSESMHNKREPEATASLKHDWYQTESYVMISLMVKDKRSEDVCPIFQPDNVRVEIRNEDGSKTDFSVATCYLIVPEECSFKAMKTKIDVKLKKKDGIRWTTLTRTEGTTSPVIKNIPKSTSTLQEPASYPSSSKKKYDWTRLEAEVSKEEEAGEGEEALNRLFRKIYSENSDDVKRAMMKSFSESGGTVLSTNWDEVGKDKVTVKPPDGMEFKQWEQ